jgi:hypothetical protein
MYYEDDHFHPGEKNELDNISVNNKNILLDIKKMDKGYNKIKRKLNKLWVDGKYYNTVYIEYYSSGDNGSRIRNAVTGFRMNEKVGSVGEDLFFKVKLINGHYKKGSGNLFYDSPEQYEKHQFCVLDANIKEMWYKKQIQAKQQQLNN